VISDPKLVQLAELQVQVLRQPARGAIVPECLKLTRMLAVLSRLHEGTWTFEPQFMQLHTNAVKAKKFARQVLAVDHVLTAVIKAVVPEDIEGRKLMATTARGVCRSIGGLPLPPAFEALLQGLEKAG